MAFGLESIFGGGPLQLMTGLSLLSNVFGNLFPGQNTQASSKPRRGFGIGDVDATTPGTQFGPQSGSGTGVGVGIGDPGDAVPSTGRPVTRPSAPRRRQEPSTSGATSRGDKQLRISREGDPPELAALKESVGRSALQNTLTTGSPQLILDALGPNPTAMIGDFVDLAVSATGSNNPEIIRPIVEQFILEAALTSSIPQSPDAPGEQDFTEFLRSLGIDPGVPQGDVQSQPLQGGAIPIPLNQSLAQFQFNPFAQFGFPTQGT